MLAIRSDAFTDGCAYERFMGRWSRALGTRLIRFAGLRDRDLVLDVGSGTGALASAIVAARPSSQIVGIDPAAGFVAFAQARHLGIRAHFEVGDARHLRFSDRLFDRTVAFLALNFISEPACALSEMIRVTRRGGIVAAAVWDYGGDMAMLRAFWDEAIALRPDADPRDERHMPLCRCGELAALWREHGLQDVLEEPLTVSTPFSSFDDYWLPFLGGQGPAGAYIAALRARERKRLRARLRRRLLGHKREGSIVLSARAWAVRGIVASRAGSAGR
jgi:SAM-dependent methyltransferase